MQAQLLIICAPLSSFLSHPHTTEVWGPSPGARVSEDRGHSQDHEEEQRCLLLTSSVEPKLPDKGEDLLRPSPALSHPFFLAQCVSLPLGQERGGHPARVFPRIALPLLLWKKGHGYTETLRTWHMCHTAVQCLFS